MNLQNEIERLNGSGYSDLDATARLCQDVILLAIGKSRFAENVTIKGGVVMRNLSHDIRRVTQDIDFDFIKYPLSDDAIDNFIEKLNCVEGLELSANKPFTELNHQDYKGKRVRISITDETGFEVEGKLDIGVHRDEDVLQDRYCFDLCFSGESVSLLMNSPEQVLVEKMKSLLRFGAGTTRYKDIYDICFLTDFVNHSKVSELMKKYVYDDETLSVKNKDDAMARLKTIFDNKRFVLRLNRSDKNWLDLSAKDVVAKFTGVFTKPNSI